MATALITGGTKRIGYHIAAYFAEKGYDLILHDHKKSAARENCLAQLEPKGVKIHFISADLTNQKVAQTFVEDITNHFAVPDVFIHTASLFENDNADNFMAENWHKNMMIHCYIPSDIIRHLVKHKIFKSATFLIDQRIKHPNPDFFTYTASKMLCGDLVKLLSLAHAPHVRINGISPGPTLRNSRQHETDFQMQANATPLGRAVDPKEIAMAAHFLAESSATTGEIITIDSGQSLDWRTESYLKVRE
ncbi:MAG: SDR family oxidoreductase [Pseudomonadota bacterium]